MGGNDVVERENELRKAKPEKNLDAMDAESADKLLRPLENYIGVFLPESLRKIKIVSYPASLLVLTDEHWISFYLSDKNMEIMDSMGYLAKDDIDEDLEAFVTAHATAKEISTTPRIQQPDSNLCSLYAIGFLYYRSFECGTLCDFCENFRPDLSLNTKIIKNFFSTILKINNR